MVVAGALMDTGTGVSSSPPTRCQANNLVAIQSSVGPQFLRRKEVDVLPKAGHTVEARERADAWGVNVGE